MHASIVISIPFYFYFIMNCLHISSNKIISYFSFIVTRCKCKVTEVVGRQVFDLPSQVLSLVYSQTLCW